MSKKVFIDGMSCGHCASRVEKSLSALAGVTQVKVNLEGKFAEVEVDGELEETEVSKAIDQAGFQLVKVS